MPALAETINVFDYRRLELYDQNVSIMRTIYIILVVILSSTFSFGQNDRLYTMFVFNKLQYNPAYAGSAEILNLGVHYRHQWQGLEGAPRTITAFGHTPIAGGRSGVGLSIISDEIGLFNSTYTRFDYAYRIEFKNQTKLSMGLSAEYDFTRFDWSRADLVDNVDDVIPFGSPSSSAFNAGMGVYFSGPNFYVGASIPRFLRNAITSENFREFTDLNGWRAYYLMGGAIFKLSSKVHIRPSLLVSYVENAPREIDFNLSLLFLESFWIGGSYRLGESVDAFVQFPLSKKIKLAVGVDYALTELNAFTRGSFEVMVEYSFLQTNNKVNNIRFF